MLVVCNYICTTTLLLSSAAAEVSRMIHISLHYLKPKSLLSSSFSQGKGPSYDIVFTYQNEWEEGMVYPVSTMTNQSVGYYCTFQLIIHQVTWCACFLDQGSQAVSRIGDIHCRYWCITALNVWNVVVCMLNCSSKKLAYNLKFWGKYYCENTKWFWSWHTWSYVQWERKRSSIKNCFLSYYSRPAFLCAGCVRVWVLWTEWQSWENFSRGPLRLWKSESFCLKKNGQRKKKDKD